MIDRAISSSRFTHQQYLLNLSHNDVIYTSFGESEIFIEEEIMDQVGTYM